MWNNTPIELPDDALPALEDLDGDLRLLAEKIGDVRKALEIGQLIGSTPLRLTGVGKWLRRHRDRCMRREYDTGEITGEALARKYKLGDRQVWNILGSGDEAVDARQMGLFK
jgi:hypothetical protein